MFFHRLPAGANAFEARLAPTNVGTLCAFLTGREKSLGPPKLANKDIDSPEAQPYLL
jgi:hypothetical protein